MTTAPRKSTVIVAPPSSTSPADRRSLIAQLRKTANRTVEQDRQLLEALADEMRG
jgi:hypothetical protein